MKCSSCGQEFGNGDNCANCGVDRVTGLGHYYGYQTPASSVPITDTRIQSAADSAHNDSGDQQSICWHCGEIIPKGAKYCPFCATLLIVRCPNCGLEYSSRYPVCRNCGTNREEYEERKRKEIEEKENLLKSEETEKQLQIERNRTEVLNYIYKNRNLLKQRKNKTSKRSNYSIFLLLCSSTGLIISAFLCGDEDAAVGVLISVLSSIFLVLSIILTLFNNDTPESDFISQMGKRPRENSDSKERSHRSHPLRHRGK